MYAAQKSTAAKVASNEVIGVDGGDTSASQAAAER
jgi:hypothetical protein